MNRFILIIWLFFSGFQIFAQNLQDTLVKIGEVKIIDKKIIRPDRNWAICFEPIKVDPQIIIQNNTESLSELLKNNSSIFIKSYGNGSVATASVRGAGASHTQILWNDIPLNNPMLGQADLSLIPTFFFNNAEILSGINSLNSTTGALGGSIELKSIPENDKFNTEIILNYGSFNTFQTFTKIVFGNSKLSNTLKFFCSRSDNNFIFKNTANGNKNYEKQKNAEFSGVGILYETAYHISEKKILNLKFWLQNNIRNIPPIMSFQGSDRKENQIDNSFKGIFSYVVKNTKFTENLSVNYIHKNLDYFLDDLINAFYFERINSKSSINSAQLKYLIDFSFSKNFFLTTNLTTKYQEAQYFDRKTNLGYQATRKTNELFTAVHYQIFPSLSEHFIFRINNTDLKFLPLMFSERLEFIPFKNIPLNISSSIGRNYHNPSLNDLYWIPGGNPDLLPEEAHSGDFNINYYFRGGGKITGNTKLSIFSSVVNNQILWQPSEFGYWKAQNIQKVFARGIENSTIFKFQFNKLKSFISVNYSFTKSTDQSSEKKNDLSYGKQLIYTPLHKANTSLNIEYSDWSFNFSYRYTGKRFTDFSQENSRNILPAYRLADFFFLKKIFLKKIKFEIKFNIDNLFNKEYQEILWRAMPGRNYMMSIKFNFKK